MNTTIENAPALRIDAALFKGHPMPSRCKLERRIVWNLLKHLERAGFKPVRTWDGDVFENVAGREAAREAMEFIFNLDEVSLRVSKSGGPDDEHGILLVLGNGEDIVSDWNYFHDDRDGFNAAMEKFDPYQFI